MVLLVPSVAVLRAVVSEVEGSICSAASAAAAERVFALSAKTFFEIVVRSERNRRKDELVRRSVEMVRIDS
jgi:hypothetical protein